MTIEEIKAEKALLKKKIERAAEEFHAATGLYASGKFSSETRDIKDWKGNFYDTTTRVEVIINPIEI